MLRFKRITEAKKMDFPGLEHLLYSEIVSIIKKYVYEIIDVYSLRMEIKDIELSRSYSPCSELDAVLTYTGGVNGGVLRYLLNENEFYIDGVRIIIIPNKE